MLLSRGLLKPRLKSVLCEPIFRKTLTYANIRLINLNNKIRICTKRTEIMHICSTCQISELGGSDVGESDLDEFDCLTKINNKLA